MSQSPSRGLPRSPRLRPPQSPTEKLYRVLVSRLSTPLLSSLVLVPILPSNRHNLLFEVLPFYKSCKALLERNHSSRKAREAKYQQWLTYWLIYTLVRFCEDTRYNLDSLPIPSWPKTLSAYLLQWLRWTLGHLSSHPTSRPSMRKPIAATTPTAPPAYRSSLPTPSLYPAKHPTLASQLAGTPRRWTIIKCILLFYAMDEELQGARWILEKLVKPFVGFFTSIDAQEEAIPLPRESASDRSPAHETVDDRRQVQEEEGESEEQVFEPHPITQSRRELWWGQP